MNLRLSIIIPVYNVEEYIRNCLDSIVRGACIHQSQLEVIIVNDGSTDGCGGIVDDYASRFSYIKVIHQKNKGVAQARNTGIESALGEWIYLVDSDDWMTEQGISAIITFIEECDDADILLFDAVKNIGSKELVWEHFSGNMVWASKDAIRKLQRKVLYIQSTPLAAPWDKVYRAAFLKERHILFQEQLQVLDDMVFNVEAIGAAEKIFYCKEKIYHYRYVSDSITNSYKPDRVERDKRVWKYLKEYMYRVFVDGEWPQTDKEEFLQSYYCRVIKSFSICCRLCFFHEKNKNPLSHQIDYLKKVIADSHYNEAFGKVKLRNLEWRLKLVVILIRLNMAHGIYWLHRANTWWEKRLGEK